MSAFSLFAAIPNLISIGRLVLVPVVVALIVQGDWKLAFLGFLVAGVSDGVDGFIAKRFDLRTELGAYLDPLADKALLVSIYVTLAVIGVIPAVLTIAVVSRDMMIVGAVIISMVLDRPVKIQPLLISKINTVAQIGFAAAVLAAKAFALGTASWLLPAAYGVATLTLISGGAYFMQWLRHMSA